MTSIPLNGGIFWPTLLVGGIFLSPEGEVSHFFLGIIARLPSFWDSIPRLPLFF
jgi:hypothetical protein